MFRILWSGSDSLTGGLRRRWLAAVTAVAVTASLLHAVPAAAAATLTAEFSDMPAHHNGSAFTFDLMFSVEPDISYRTLRDEAFTVVGGTVRRAKRALKGSNTGWIISVQPDVDSNGDAVGDVTITLPATTSCTDKGAICTENDVLMLSEETSATVAGPATEEEEEEPAVVLDPEESTSVVVSPAAVTAVEGGDAGAYSVVLASAPGADVTVTVGGATADVSVAPTHLTFTAVNWSAAQTVTVTAVDDTTAEGPETVTLTHSVTSTDSDYQGATAGSVVVSVVDSVTARFSDAPASHDGSSFRFNVTFTPEPKISYTTMRDRAFTVVNGTVTKTPRAEKGSSDRWAVVVEPAYDSNENPVGDVTITLPATEACTAAGAICTAAGEMLSNETTITVPLDLDHLPSRPGPPGDVTATPGPDIGQITVTWTEAATGAGTEAAVRGYRVRHDCTGETETARLGSGARSFKIDDLDRSRSCRINVAARNDGGFGPVAWAGSDSTYHQPMNPPEAPASITVTPDENSAGTKVTWTAPAGGDAPTSYQIAYWDIGEGSFQYVSHDSTTDLEAVIDVAPADLRTVAVRGHLGGVAYEDLGVRGAWATGWHTSATASRLDAMTQSASLSLSLADTASIDLSGITGAMCPDIAGLYVDTVTDTAWMADPCSNWVHAYDIGSDGTLTHNLETTLTRDELYPEGGIGRLNPTYSPAALWSDGETLWVGDKGEGFLLPYQLSDGAFLFDHRFMMVPRHTPDSSLFATYDKLGPSAVWSDGNTVWVADDLMVPGLIYAMHLVPYPDYLVDAWILRPELRFVPSAFDSCYIPEHPRLRGPANTTPVCADGTALRDAIHAASDEVVGAYSDGRWLWVAVDYYERSRAGKLLAFNLLTGERAASRDIALPSNLTDPIGVWSDGEKLWVTAHFRGKKLYTFSIPSSG